MILLAQTTWEVKETPSKGKGIFAKETIVKGTFIGDYIGNILHPRDAIVDENNFYLMYYHDRAAISPDLSKPGVHLLNHSCAPNAVFYIYKGHTLAFALQDIYEGEEITLNYALAPKDGFCEPCEHLCFCGTKQCTGSMHLSKARYLAWRKLTETQAKETKKQRIRYGKPLPRLADYPKCIPEEYIRKANDILTSKMQ